MSNISTHMPVSKQVTFHRLNWVGLLLRLIAEWRSWGNPPLPVEGAERRRAVTANERREGGEMDEVQNLALKRQVFTQKVWRFVPVSSVNEEKKQTTVLSSVQYCQQQCRGCDYGAESGAWPGTSMEPGEKKSSLGGEKKRTRFPVKTLSSVRTYRAANHQQNTREISRDVLRSGACHDAPVWHHRVPAFTVPARSESWRFKGKNGLYFQNKSEVGSLGGKISPERERHFNQAVIATKRWLFYF